MSDVDEFFALDCASLTTVGIIQGGEALRAREGGIEYTKAQTVRVGIAFLAIGPLIT